jgi:hypothetical protein
MQICILGEKGEAQNANESKVASWRFHAAVGSDAQPGFVFARVDRCSGGKLVIPLHRIALRTTRRLPPQKELTLWIAR